jgi:tetratricopeptide (TPR) repeat protein
MNFDSYINKAWDDHANAAEKVAESFESAKSLIESSDQIPQLVTLVTHVMGEHLALWQKGIDFLKSLRSHAQFVKDSEADKAINRSIASLKLGGDLPLDMNQFRNSDQIRIFAVVASALCEKDLRRSLDFFNKALDLAGKGLDAKDPANRALAVTGNNLACTFEEKANRSAGEIEFMIKAAKTARKYWELAGTWSQVGWAEYRLAMTYIQAKDFPKALSHAQLTVEIFRNNGAGPFEMFFAYEAMAQVEKFRQSTIGFEKALEQAKDYLSKTDEKNRSYCEKIFVKLLQK